MIAGDRAVSIYCIVSIFSYHRYIGLIRRLSPISFCCRHISTLPRYIVTIDSLLLLAMFHIFSLY
ncbi:hypothetical protein F5Y12DRAFT_763198 [Xylaria sp. FL1777]|nr:hypothetical protein F5Y12DRAFT_763198 [Xylaria sp. FL1777]